MTTERDLAAAAKVTYAYEHGKPERPSLEHHIAEAIAAARAEGIAEGEKRERAMCEQIVLCTDTHSGDPAPVAEVRRELAAAIRARGGNDGR